MYTLERLFLLLVLLQAPLQAQAAEVGTAPNPQLWNTSIMPDGSGLPAGSGDARTGAAIYLQQCFACHGEKGQGGINDTLAGGIGSLTQAKPLLTLGSYWPYATTIFDYVRRAMPYPSPGTLSNDQVYALTAYLLQINGIIDDDIEMNAITLPAVEMPNRNGFVPVYR